MKIVVDAYAWVEVFIGTEKGKKVRELLEGENAIYTPSTVLAEIARKYLREGIDSGTIAERLRAIADTAEITQINIETAMEAAQCYKTLLDNAKKEGLNNPSLFDAMVLATANLLRANVVTGDMHFKNLGMTYWIGK